MLLMPSIIFFTPRDCFQENQCLINKHYQVVLWNFFFLNFYCCAFVLMCTCGCRSRSSGTQTCVQARSWVLGGGFHLSPCWSGLLFCSYTVDCMIDFLRNCLCFLKWLHMPAVAFLSNFFPFKEHYDLGLCCTPAIPEMKG